MFLRKKEKEKKKQTLHVEEMSREASKKKRTWRRIVLALSFVVLIAGLYWFIIMSPTFRITEFIVEGNKRVSDEETISLMRERFKKESSWKQFLGFDHFWVWPAVLQKDELKNFPAFTDFSFERHYSAHRLVMNVQERLFFATWCKEGEGDTSCLWFDEQGVFFEKAFEPLGFLVRTVYEETDTIPAFGESFLSREEFERLHLIFEMKEVGRWSTERLLLTRELREIEIKIHGGPLLRFSLDFAAPYAADVIHTLKLKGEFPHLTYVDFRIRERVFYK